jgi:hypothetical protein
LGTKDDFRIDQSAFGFVEAAASDAGIAVGVIDVIEKRQEDLVIGRKMRVELDVEQANVLCAGRRAPSEGTALLAGTESGA